MIYQTDTHHCGQAAVRNVIQKFYKTSKISYRPLLNECFSFKDMKDSLSEFGIEAEGYEYDSVNDLKKLKGMKIILFCVEGKNHFVILKRQLLGLFYVFDPAKGNVVFKEDDFIRLSAKKVLVCNLKEKKTLSKIEIIPFKEEVCFALLAFMETLAFGSIYYSSFIRTDSLIFALSILVFVFVVFMNQVHSLNLFNTLMKRLGNGYIGSLQSKSELRNLSSLISSCIGKEEAIFSCVFSSILVLALLFFSNHNIFLLLIVCFISDWMIYFSFKNMKRRREQEISESEQKMLERKSDDYFQKAVDDSTMFGKITQLESFLSIFIIAVFTLIFCFLTQVSSIGEGFGLLLFMIFGVREIDKPIKKLLSESNPYDYILHLNAEFSANPNLYRRKKGKKRDNNMV